MRIKSLSQVGMTVESLTKSIEFYWGILRIPILEVMELPSYVIKELYGLEDTKVKIALMRCGWGSFIELFEFTPANKKNERVDVQWNRPGMTHIALDVGNVKKAFESLKAKGVEFISEPMVINGTDVVFLKDPDGNLVELIDMGLLYYANKFLGKFVGGINMKTKFKDLEKI